MNPTVAVTFPSGNEAKVENTRAIILLCQDREENYVVAWGARNELQKLLVWGSRNWFMLPPGKDYFEAVNEVLETGIVEGDAAPLSLVSPSCDAGGKGAGGTRFEIRLPDRKIALSGIDSSLLFGSDEFGVKVRATGGSGIQKHFLLETGIAALFGSDAARRFAERMFSGAPDGMRQLLEGMRDEMRKHPDADIVVTAQTAAAIGRRSGKN